MREFHRLTRVPLAAALLLIGSQPARTEGTDRGASSIRSDQALHRWIEALAFAESGNRAWIVHRDRDGRDYYGCLQFRLSTFQYYIDKFDFVPNAENADFMDLIYDCAFQKRLAARMIRDDPGNWKHWKKSVKRIGMPPGAAFEPDRAAPAASGRTLEVENRKPVNTR